MPITSLSATCLLASPPVSHDLELWRFGLLLIAAFAGGAVNAVAGGGSVITFPTLLWVGIDPIVANATNTVALWPGVVGASFGFRRELGQTPRPLFLLVLPALAGGLAGAVLLLNTPSEVFERLAPFLILLATALLAIREPLTGRLPERSDERSTSWWWIAVSILFVIAVYGGYFGAGMGILILGTFGLFGFRDMHRMNALKNVLAVAVNGVAFVYFALAGAVDWPVAAVMAAGSVAGGLASASVSRGFRSEAVRRAVVAIGVAMAISLLVRLYA